MTIQPLHVATTTVAIALVLFATVRLFTGVEGIGIEPDPDPAAHLKVDLQEESDPPPPRHRPALGFELGVSKRADVLSWATEAALTCKTVAMGRRLSCQGAMGDVTARFDGRGILTRIELRRRLAASDRAESLYAEASRQVETEVGPPTSCIRPEGFVHSAYERIERRFDYPGYEATITATHFGARGLQLRERYRATK